MLRNTGKQFLLASIVWSMLLMILFTQPWMVDLSDYTLSRSWVMWVSWLVWMLVIIWQILLGIRVRGFVKYFDAWWLNKVHRYLWVWTLIALIFHPLAAMIAYGTTAMNVFVYNFESVYAWWVSVWKIAFDCLLIVWLLFLVSRKIMTYRWKNWLHLSLYPIALAVWWHAWFTWSMIAELPLVRWYWLVLGGVLVVSSTIKIVYEIYYQISNIQVSQRHILHAAPLSY